MVEIKKKIVGMGSSSGIIIDTVILDKFSLKKGDYVLVDVKRKIINPDLIGKQMPVPVKIKTAFRTFDCFVIADTGSEGWLQTIQMGRDYAGKEIKDRQIFQVYDKSVIQEIQFSKKIPFELNGSIISNIRQAQNQFPKQWIENHPPKPNQTNPETLKLYFQKINKLGENK